MFLVFLFLSFFFSSPYFFLYVSELIVYNEFGVAEEGLFFALSVSLCA